MRRHLDRKGRLVLVHRTEIVFGVLEVVFCGDTVASLGFGTSQRQVTLVGPLRVLRASRMPNGLRLDFPELVPSLPHVSLLFAILRFGRGGAAAVLFSDFMFMSLPLRRVAQPCDPVLIIQAQA